MTEKIEQAQIFVKEFPVCVRMRHGMYISDINQMLTEIVDNSTDEAVAGYCKNIVIARYPSKEEYVVQDDGRGIPVTEHPSYPGKSQVEIAMCTLHGGGKFNDAGGYENVKTGGLNGVGASCVQALSEYMNVYVVTDGKKYQIDFAKGYVTEKVRCIEENTEDSRGTTVIFKPDEEIWKDDDPFDEKRFINRVRQLSFLNAGITYYFIPDAEAENPETKEFYSENGLKDYVTYLINGKQAIIEPVGLKTELNDVEVQIGFVYTDGYSNDTHAFCNNMLTELKSDHVQGFNAGLVSALKNYIKEYNIKLDFKSDDIKEGLTAVVAVRVANPNFEGQAKTVLKMKKVRDAVREITEQTVADFLDKNPNMAKVIIDKITMAAKARLAAQKARELTRKKSSSCENSSPLKLADCTSKDPKECEIYIVEGDSAGGSAKQGRDRKFQAILPVFGKILNVEKQRLEKILSSEKIAMINGALKCNIDEDFDITKLPYHRIIIMADADVDGAHIKCLHTTYIYRHMRPIIEQGMLYYALPPLYKVYTEGKNGKVEYAYDDNELEEKKQLLGPNALVQRYKGLGEMNPSQLWETTMNPENRKLIRVTIDDAEECERIISLLMGEAVEPRKEWIQENAQYAEIDV